MSELTIQFTTRSTNSEDEQPPQLFVNLSFPERGLYTAPIPFTPPLDGKDLNEIRWYLELWFFGNTRGTPRYGDEVEWKLFSQTE